MRLGQLALRGAHLPLVAAKGNCLNEPTARAAQGTLLLIGSGVLADSLAKDLTGKGTAPQRATSARAAATAATLRPALIVLAGDAAQHRGATVLAALAQADNASLPVLVICAPLLDDTVSQQAPRHVGFLAPEGGMSECARRIRTILELLVEEGLVTNSLQQLTTTASARAKPPASARATATRTLPLVAAAPRLPQAPTASASTRQAPAATAATEKAAVATARPWGQPLTSAASVASTRSSAKAEATPAVASAKAKQPPPLTGRSAAAPIPATTPATTPASEPSLKAAPAEKRPAGTWATAANTSPSLGSKPGSHARAPRTPFPSSADARATAAAREARESGKPPEPLATAPEAVPATKPGAPVENVESNSDRPTRPPTRLAPARDNRPATPELVASIEPSPVGKAPASQDEPEQEVFVSFFTEPPPSAVVQREEAPAAQPTPTARAPLGTTESARLAPATGPARREVDAVHEPPAREAPPPLKPRQATASFDPVAPPAHDVTPETPPVLKPRRAASPLDPVARPAHDVTPETPPVLKPRRAASPLDPVARPAHDVTPETPPVLKPRRAASPLDPVALPAQPSNRRATGEHTAAAASGGARSPSLRRADAPLLATAYSPEPAAPASLADLAAAPDRGAKPRRAVALTLGMLAALGGGALFFYARDDGAAERASAAAAAGALHQAPIASPVPAASEPIVAAGSQQGTSPADTAGGPPTQPAAQERPAGVGRRTEPAREPAPTSALGRAQALVDEGIALSRERRFGLAEGLYLKALQASPEYPNAMAELVRVHLARRDGVEAIRWANRLIAAQPNNGVHQLLLGDAQKLRGDEEAAREAWTKAAHSGNAAARKRLADE